MSLLNLYKVRLKTYLSFFLYKGFTRLARSGLGRLPQGPLLVIAPHPDDETLGCGALIARYVATGHKVRIMIVTDGRYSSPSTKLSPDDIARLRHHEAQNAIRTLGVPSSELVFLPYRDTESKNYLLQIEHDIASQIWLTHPALIVSPYGIDSHEDHRVIAQAVNNLIQKGKVPCAVWNYPMWFWPRQAMRHLLSLKRIRSHIIVPVDTYGTCKNTALDAYKTQFENLTGEENWHILDPNIRTLHVLDHELFFEIFQPASLCSSVS
ncbi:MAG: PIG-L family deacetylase [Alphaproteobacteria bacterium]|nr:PIG-L family deacetylase [Alphaproteobacteria bacterium]